MKSLPSPPCPGDLFPELSGQPVRTFTETGWGRFPIQLDAAGLSPAAFAVYCRLSVIVDRRESLEDVPAELARRCCMPPERVAAVLETLKARHFLTVDGENWTLTDPTTWLPA